MKYKFIQFIAIILTAAMLGQDTAQACPDLLRPVAMAEKTGVHSVNVTAILHQIASQWHAYPSFRYAVIAAGALLAAGAVALVVRKIRRAGRTREEAMHKPAAEFEPGADNYGRAFIKHVGKNYYAEDIIALMLSAETARLGGSMFNEAARKFGASGLAEEVLSGLTDREVEALVKMTGVNVEKRVNRANNELVKGGQASFSLDNEVSLGVGKTFSNSPVKIRIFADKKAGDFSLAVRVGEGEEKVYSMTPGSTFVVAGHGQTAMIDTAKNIYRLSVGSKAFSPAKQFTVTVHKRDDAGLYWVTIIFHNALNSTNISCNSMSQYAILAQKVIIAPKPAEIAQRRISPKNKIRPPATVRPEQAILDRAHHNYLQIVVPRARPNAQAELAAVSAI